MTKRVYRVTHQGIEHKRTTDRIYTHVVLVRRDYQTALDEAVDTTRERARSRHAFYAREGNPATRQYSHPAEHLAEYERIATLTCEQYEAEQVEKARATIEKQRQNGVFDTLGPLTWCGRPDLAAKEEAKARKTGYWAEIVVLPVPQP